jgi:hypothetical protein
MSLVLPRSSVSDSRYGRFSTETGRQKRDRVGTNPVSACIGPMRYSLGIGHTFKGGQVAIDYAPRILAMNDAELEVFVNKWLERKKATYVQTDHFAGSGDLGRDVVGYCTSHKLDGAWHNYQCKQFKTQPLRVPAMLAELAKILVHSARGEYSLPEHYYFVAPRGLGREAKKLLASPSKLKATLIADWDKSCASAVEEHVVIALDASILAKINEFKFENIHGYDVPKLLLDNEIKPVLVDCFGADPGPPPTGTVPDNFDWNSIDADFARQLVSLYGDEDASITDRLAAASHPKYGCHLRDQFVRYFEADAFKRHFRDNTPAGYVSGFEQDICHGVRYSYEKAPPNTLERVDVVTDKAGTLPIGGLLGGYAGTRAKQGICHHLVNADELQWKK